MAPTDLFTRLSRQGVRLNAEPEGWERALLLRFWRVEDSDVVLKLESEADPAALHVGLGLWAIFENMGRMRTFTSEVTAVLKRPDGTLAGVKIRLPDEVKSEDRRRAFRVPKIFPFAIRATLHSGENSWPATLKNLSVLGALLSLPDGIAESLPDDAPYKLELKTFEGDASIGAVFVRRTRSGAIAFKFPSATRMGEVAPPPELAKVVRTAELIWLRKAKGTDKTEAA